MDKIYRFYASFENTICKDYITEKVHKALLKNIVPVIFGGSELENFIPPKSYINVRDFESVKDLAEYLIYLSKNPEEYIKYFWWKQYYVLKHFNINFCELCEFLHEHQGVTAKVYKKFRRFVEHFYWIFITI